MNFIENYKKKFKNKLFAAFILTGLIPLLILMILYYSNILYIINKKVNTSIKDNLEIMALNIDSSIENFENIVNFVSNNQDIKEVLMKKQYNSYEERFECVQKIYRITYPLLAARKSDIPLYIIGYNNQYSKFSTSEYFSPEYESLTSDIFHSINRSEGRNTLYIHRRVDGKDRKDVVLAIGQQIRNLIDNSILGYVVLDIYDDYFNDIFKETKVYQDTNVYVVNKEGIIITDKLYKNKTGFKLYPEYINTILNDTSGNFNINIKDKKYICYFTTCSRTGLKIVEVVPYNMMYKDVKFIIYIFVMIVLTLGIVATWASYKLSKNISEPINNLSNLMQQVEKGDMNVNFKLNCDDEIGKLGESFNNMVREINRLIDEVYKKQYLLKEAELKALKAQINPHFLYNTLESINWMAKMNNSKGASEMITTLGKFLRYSISKNSDSVTVSQVVEQINNYLKIQKMRYGDKFTVHIDIDKSILDKQIPKLLLQPLVENAIVHGIEPKLDKGNIIIKGFKDEKKLYFQIIDDGVGLKDNLITGIGFNNVKERIQIQYGEQYGVTITNDGVYTYSTVVIPCENSLEMRNEYEEKL